jgi:GTP-binding protein
LGIVELSDFRRFVMADIPGIIEDAHVGAGLGYEFLKHIERTTILVHIIDIMPTDGSEPIDNYKTIRNELIQYSQKLADKAEVIVLNKADLDPDDEIVNDLKKQFDTEVYPISAVTGKGLSELSELLWKKVKKA